MNSVQLNNLVSVAANASGQAAAPLPQSNASRPAGRVAATAPSPAPAPPAAALPGYGDAGRQAIEQAVKHIREFFQNTPADIEFSLDDQSGRVLLRVMDRQTKQILLQVPSETILAVARALDRNKGLLLHQKA